MSRMSMATRISLLAAFAVGLSVSVASLAVYITLGTQLHDSLDNALLERASAASRMLGGTSAPIGGATSALLGAADARICYIYTTGRVWPPGNASWVQPVTAAELKVAGGTLPYSLRTINRNGHAARAATVPLSSGVALMFVQSTEPIERTLARMGIILLIVGLAGIVVAAVTGLAVARSALRPVRRLSAAAEHIARTEELEPIPVTGDDELASLAMSFNDMLAALARSRDRQRRLVADAGHELRTPLTSLRTNLELLAQADRRGGLTPHQRNEIFTDVTAQVEELSTLVGDLVELARDEPLERTPEPVDLADIVSHAINRVRRRASGLVFDVDVAPWWVVGEAQILERAVTNLLDNAAKWSPAGATVKVSLASGSLSVADEGPGVSEPDLPMIFERFYRAADARTMPGSGLGLSIVRQAAQRHGGTVTAANRQPHGAIFTMTLPGTPEPATVASPAPPIEQPVSARA
jgi:two-component system sensor histidine kinase MprB